MVHGVVAASIFFLLLMFLVLFCYVEIEVCIKVDRDLSKARKKTQAEGGTFGDIYVNSGRNDNDKKNL